MEALMEKLTTKRRRELEEAHSRTVKLLDNNSSIVGRWRERLRDKTLDMFSSKNNPGAILLEGNVRQEIYRLRKSDTNTVRSYDLCDYTFTAHDEIEAAFVLELWRRSAAV